MLESIDKLILYDDFTSCFQIVDLDHYEGISTITFKLNDRDAKGDVFKDELKDYGCIFLHRSDYKENDIYQVYEKNSDSRIGWIFPVNSIISNAHDFANNPHYCRYAFVAHKILINTNKNILDDDSFIQFIDDKTNDGLILLIYKNELVEKLNDSNLLNYLPSLYYNGYYLQSRNKNIFVASPVGEKIYISETSEILKFNTFIEKLFKEIIFNDIPFIKFHILYQVIELLIEDILIYNLKLTIQKHEQKKLYTRSLREKISKVETEKDRINLLFEKINISNLKESLDQACDDFLTSKGREHSNFPDTLYSFRNFVVHDYRNMLEDNQIITDINEIFEMIVSELSMNYKQIEKE
jgi:hypothetical protein